MPHYLPIDRLRVRSLDVDRKEFTWEVNDTQEDALDYTFQVLRSESPEGPFEPITQTFEDRYIFVDARVPQGDRFRQLWYRLRVVHKASGDVREYGSVTQEAEPSLDAQFIRRSEMTLLTQVIGRARRRRARGQALAAHPRRRRRDAEKVCGLASAVAGAGDPVTSQVGDAPL